MKNKQKNDLDQSKTRLRIEDFLGIKIADGDLATNDDLCFFEEKYSYGICWLWWYTKLAQEGLLKSFPESTQPNFNYDWFLATEKLICSWDGKEKLEKEKADQISQFITLIQYFSYIDIFSPWHSAKLDLSINKFIKEDIKAFKSNYYGWQDNFLKEALKATLNSKLNKEYSFGSLLTITQLGQLLNTKNLIQDGKLIILCSNDYSCFHAKTLYSALYKQGDKYFYFDPDSCNGNGEFVTGSIEEIINAICNINFEPLYRHEMNLSEKKEDWLEGCKKSFPLSLRIFSFEKEAAEYPTQKELLEAIRPDTNRGEYSSLNIAARLGDLENVIYFLKNGANPNYYSERGDCASLALAARHGDVEIVSELIASGADVNLKSRYKRTALICAAMWGHFDVVKKLISSGASIDIQEEKKWTALNAAAYYGFTDVVKELLAQKANPDLQNEHGWTALMYAANCGHISIVNELLAVNANVNILSKEKNTALIAASVKGCVEIVNKLIAAGVDVNFQNKKGWTALSFATLEGQVQVVKNLILAGAPIDGVTKKGFTALIIAASNGKTEVVKELLAQGSNPNLRDIYGNTPLMYAADNGYLDVVQELLLIKDIDVSAVDIDGQNALMKAAQSGYFNAVEKLIDTQKFDIDKVDNKGNTALMLAAKVAHVDLIDINDYGKPGEISNKNYIKVVKQLFNAHAKVNMQNKDGETALILAARWPRPEFVKELLENGADVNIKDKYGKTALLHAINITIINDILTKGANVNLQTDDGTTALMEEARFSHPDNIKKLLEHGADPNTQDIRGRTALMLANYPIKYDTSCSSYELEVTKELITHEANINIQDNDGMTALMHAINQDSSKVAKLLLADKNLDTNVKNKDGFTALDLEQHPEHRKKINIDFEHTEHLEKMLAKINKTKEKLQKKKEEFVAKYGITLEEYTTSRDKAKEPSFGGVTVIEDTQSKLNEDEMKLQDLKKLMTRLKELLHKDPTLWVDDKKETGN